MLCNYLQNVAAITYIFVLQLSTFLFYNKQRSERIEKEYKMLHMITFPLLTWIVITAALY